ncbi:MAG: Ig-like domain-containing protein [Clostridia bacterium]|nr:Ig-like domain-containing protein [Clostridia bacterium]
MKRRIRWLCCVFCALLMWMNAALAFSFDPATNRIIGAYESEGNVEIWLDGRLAGGSRLSIPAESGEHTIQVYENGKLVYEELFTVPGDWNEPTVSPVPSETPAPTEAPMPTISPDQSPEPTQEPTDAPTPTPVPVKPLAKGGNGTFTLNVGEALQLSADFAAQNGWLVKGYKSGKAKVASVDESGLVRAIAEGSAKITVTTSKKKATITIKVTDPYKPTSVRFASASITMNLGDTLELDPLLLPNTAKATYTWKSSKAKVASVANGVVTALSEGKSKITVTTLNKKKASVTIQVVDPLKPTGVKFEDAKRTLKVGDTFELVPLITPNTAQATYTWKSGKAKVATVNNGVVTALSKGTAKITVTTQNKKKATITIVVSD